MILGTDWGRMTEGEAKNLALTLFGPLAWARIRRPSPYHKDLRGPRTREVFLLFAKRSVRIGAGKTWKDAFEEATEALKNMTGV